MLRSIIIGFILASILIATSCKKNNTTTSNTTSTPRLIFIYKMDSTQARLDNFGQPSSMAAGHWGQNPAFHIMGVHYIEMDTSPLIQLGKGNVLYMTPTLIHGTDTAIDFTQEKMGNTGDTIYSVPLSSVKAGNYQYLRVSLAYQNYDVTFRVDTTINYGGYSVPIHQDFPCTIASFIGVNTYINDYLIKTQTVTVNGSKKQGYWGAEELITLSQYGYSQTYVQNGQAQGTTVVNPLFQTSSIPLGSCVVTGAFSPNNLVITGNETKDIVITVGLSTNQSFEWIDNNGNHKWDALSGEQVVDMGIRGMVPTIQ